MMRAYGSIREAPEMLSIALKGIPRDSYKLMTKYSTPASGDPIERMNRVVKA